MRLILTTSALLLAALAAWIAYAAYDFSRNEFFMDLD